MKYSIYRRDNTRFSVYFLYIAATVVAGAVTVLIGGLTERFPVMILIGLAALVIFGVACGLVAFVNGWNSPRARKLGRRLFAVSTWPFKSKLDRLEFANETPRLQSRGIMVRNLLQTPAVISLDAAALTLRPVIGKPVVVPLEDVRSVTEAAHFNGIWNPGQTGFMLKVAGYWRLGFAVFDDPAPWREALGGVDSDTRNPTRRPYDIQNSRRCR
jgi:hypothetical protein